MESVFKSPDSSSFVLKGDILPKKALPRLNGDGLLAGVVDATVTGRHSNMDDMTTAAMIAVKHRGILFLVLFIIKQMISMIFYLECLL